MYVEQHHGKLDLENQPHPTLQITAVMRSIEKFGKNFASKILLVAPSSLPSLITICAFYCALEITFFLLILLVRSRMNEFTSPFSYSKEKKGALFILFPTSYHQTMYHLFCRTITPKPSTPNPSSPSVHQANFESVREDICAQGY